MMHGRPPSRPLDRLGRWNGTNFEPVEAGSVRDRNVRVLSHGWAPGLGPVVEASDRFLRVWDAEAVTAEGGRFDRWYGPLAEAILTQDPASTVLAYTWIDTSGTTASKLEGGKSQLRTTAAGHSLAMALRAALGYPRPAVHLIGHSHGAKVVTVAATLLPEPPAQVTLFDSPENLLPVVGSALNDLSWYLRALPIGTGGTFVDNYPSKYGIRYGRDAGLGEIIDVALDPERFPLDDDLNEHSYAWRWYLESARDVTRGVGFAWSPLNPKPCPPAGHQLQHAQGDEQADALSLEPATRATRGRGLAETVTERAAHGEQGELSNARPAKSGLFFQRGGDQVVTVNLRWLEGPPDASLIFSLNGTERWRSTRGWSEEDVRHGAIPVGGLRSGFGFYELRLDSSEPARVEVTPGTVRALPVPIQAEYRSWLRPLAVTGLIAVPVVIAVLRRRRRPRHEQRTAG